MRKLIFVLLGYAIAFSIATIGCSSNKANQNPVSPPEMKADIPISETVKSEKSHELLGVWTMIFDPKANTVSVEPDRENFWHFNVKSYIPTPGIALKSWDPVTKILDVDVTLRNPYPITGYDVRLIIYTDDVGHMLMNADDWTALYDISGGKSINPFKAYAKSEPNRKFAGSTSHVENLQIYMDSSFNVQFAVDASYPSNCGEPYQIGKLILEEPLYDRFNDTAPVNLYAYRWNTEKSMTVFIDCPDIMIAPVELFTTDMEYYYGSVVNFLDAPAGEYQVIITAQTDNPVPLYSIDTILVTEKPIEGWVRGFPDDESVAGVETDEFGNIYFALNPSNSVVSYSRYAAVRWEKDLDNIGPFNGLYDISCHPDFGYIYCSGNYMFCGTSYYSAMGVARCGKSSGAPTHNYQCFGDPGYDYPINSTNIESDSNGYAYIEGTNEDYNGIPIIWKVDNMLTTQWTHVFDDSDGGLHFNDLEISSTDTIYGTGRFWGTTVDLDPTSGTHSYAPLGKTDAYFAEYDSAGNWLNSRRWGGYNDTEADVMGTVMDFDDNGNIIIAGRFTGTVDFNPSTYGYDIKSSAGTFPDMYISKFNASGTFQRNIQISVSEYSTAEITGLAFDMYNNVYVCGYFENTIDFDPGTGIAQRTANYGGYDMFLAKYNSDFEYVWVQTWGATGYYDRFDDVAYDRIYNYIYVVGTYSGTVDFDPGEGVYEMTSDGDRAAFLMRLLNNGTWEY